jgi:lysophospholipase L1-like esterase
MSRHFLVVAAVAALLVSAPGCTAESPNQPSGSNATSVRYTAIGASDAVGVGSSIVCVPFVECPDGTGYVPVIGRRLQAAGRAVTLVNLGIPGAVLGPELEALGNSLGREIPGNFLDREAPFVPRDSTLVTIFAGGNDANTIAAALAAGHGGGDPDAYVRDRVATFGRDLRALVDVVRGRAPDARIVALNLPNMAGLPYARNRTLAERQALQRIAVGLSAEINALVPANVTVIDLMCDNAFYDAVLYSSDGFHPNNFGHARLADKIFAVVTGGTAATPPTVCAGMFIV